MFPPFEPGDYVSMAYSGCGLPFGSEEYRWISVHTRGMVVCCRPNIFPANLRYQDEIYILLLVEDTLMWVEAENLQRCL